MTSDRALRIRALLATSTEVSPTAHRISSTARDLLDAAHVGLVIATNGFLTPLDCGDELGALLDEQQFSLGDGPTPAARLSATPVVATALSQAAGRKKWPLFAPLATSVRIGSAIALPLRAGAARLGVLTAYRTLESGPDDDQLADAIVLSSLATELLLADVAGAADALSSDIVNGLALQSVVHQAAGMVSEQLGISVVDALVRLRAHAMAVGLPLNVVGRNIVAGELVLER